MEASERYAQYAQGTLLLSRTAGKLEACVNLARYLIESIGEVGKTDPSLGPELLAAMESVKECVDHLGSAFQISTAKLDILQEQLGEESDHAQG